MIRFFLFFGLFSFSISITISPCAKWNQTGIIIGGNGVSGNGINQLSAPMGIFYHERSNSLYVADLDNNRIQMISLNQSSYVTTTVISNVGPVSSIYVDDDDKNNQTIIYIGFNARRPVQKWIQGDKKGIQIGNTCYMCTAVYLDSEKNVFTSSLINSTVYKWSPKTNLTTIFTNRIVVPNDISIDQSTDSVYVANGPLVERFSKNGSSTYIEASGDFGREDFGNSSLHMPYTIWIDKNTKTVYTADMFGKNIQRWKDSKGEIIIGTPYDRKGFSGWSSPIHITFDNEGNIYFSDSPNDVIKRYELIDNRPCHLKRI